MEFHTIVPFISCYLKRALNPAGIRKCVVQTLMLTTTEKSDINNDIFNTTTQYFLYIFKGFLKISSMFLKIGKTPLLSRLQYTANFLSNSQKLEKCLLI